MTNGATASLLDAFERALDEILVRVSVSAPSSIAVAYSGGLDSSVLLHLAHRYAALHGLALFAFHIHHGISLNADDWLAHCERECAKLGARFDAAKVTLNDPGSGGIEQAARISRYAALGELCRRHGTPLLLTAHHLDDQAETVLLQLLRGSGIAGLSGMENANTASDLLGDPNLMVGRPLLGARRAELEQFAVANKILHIEDESNLDTRYARNALRHKVMPALTLHFPGFQERFARAAQHAQAAQRVLNEVAALDLAACKEGDCIDIGKLKEFSSDRIDNLLRHWFASIGVRMPSTAWLSEMRVQLFEAKEDAQLRVTHPDCEIRRYRNKVFVTPRLDDAAHRLPPSSFRWSGEAWMDFPAYGGRLYFEPAKEGIDAAWLRQQDLLIRYRSGGEKLKPAPNRPTKPLKYHYQALSIPAWERLRLPLVCTSFGQLLFAAGIGVNWRDLHAGVGPCIRLRWEAADAYESAPNFQRL